MPMDAQAPAGSSSGGVVVAVWRAAGPALSACGFLQIVLVLWCPSPTPAISCEKHRPGGSGFKAPDALCEDSTVGLPVAGLLP